MSDPRSALLVMVHGSPRPVANEDMFRVVEAFRNRPEYRERFPIVEVGFMECNEPDIPTAIDRCIAHGATDVIAVPYFLHTGTHVCDDLPTLLEEGQRRFPNVKFKMGEYIGLSDRLTDILTERAATAPSKGKEDR
ncbi:MAG: CbiX/SirB N-terminal domain-containing protein [Capsulimonadales bacterium]|nr:CbiX/SirB N-terminal domain-containing protein [Capsulimonadales bacterium]